MENCIFLSEFVNDSHVAYLCIIRGFVSDLCSCTFVHSVDTACCTKWQRIDVLQHRRRRLVAAIEILKAPLNSCVDVDRCGRSLSADECNSVVDVRRLRRQKRPTSMILRLHRRRR